MSRDSEAALAGIWRAAAGDPAALAHTGGASMDHPFDADTAVEAVADHRYRATIAGRWNALGGRPNGGYLLAVCLQALRRSMPFPDPLVVSAFFLRPASVGSAEVTTEIARTGRRAIRLTPRA